MRGKRSLLILLVAAAAAVLLASTSASGQTGRLSDASNVNAAAGAYTADVPPVLGITGKWRFAFDVIQRGSSVLGEYKIHNPISGIDSTVTLNCLIVRGNQGIAGGTVTESTDPNRIGFKVAFAFQDTPDQISFPLTNGSSPPAITCDNLLSQSGVTSISDLLNLAAVPNQQAVVTIGAPQN